MNRGSREIYRIQDMTFRSEIYPTFVKIGTRRIKKVDRESYARLEGRQA